MKQYQATIHKQGLPIPSGKTFTTPEGEIYPDHKANFVEVGQAVGTYHECWKKAKEMTPAPIMFFKELP